MKAIYTILCFFFFLNTRASHQNVVFFSSASENNNILKIWDHVFQNNKVIKPFPQAIQIKLRMKHLKQTLLNMFKEKKKKSHSRHVSQSCVPCDVLLKEAVEQK